MSQPVFGRGRSLYVLVAIAAVAAACSGAADKPKAAGPNVWATVDGRDITSDDIEKAYRAAIDPAAPAPSDVEATGAKLSILDDFITQDLLMARAKALSIDVTGAEIESAYAERKRSMTDETFKAQLAQRGLTTEDMKRAVQRDLTVQKVLEKDVTSKIAVSDQEIGDFYAKNRSQFNLAEPQYHIAQIVITPVKDADIRNRLNDDAGSPDEAMRKAQMINDKLRAGAHFSDLAMDYSEDPQSAPQGGDLGFVPRSALDKVPPQLRDAVLKSEPGRVMTMSANGAQTLVMLIAREAAGQRDVSDPSVRDGIRDSLKQRKEQVLRSAYITAARNDAKIVNYLARRVYDAQGTLPSLVPAAPGK